MFRNKEKIKPMKNDIKGHIKKILKLDNSLILHLRNNSSVIVNLPDDRVSALPIEKQFHKFLKFLQGYSPDMYSMTNFETNTLFIGVALSNPDKEIIRDIIEAQNELLWSEQKSKPKLTF